MVDQDGVRAEFSYDAAHRLVGERTRGHEPRAIGYDPAGNIVSRPGHPALRHTEGNRLAAGADERFRYDERNRLAEHETARGGRVAYAYDSLDMLVGVTPAQGPACTFAYDGLGRRTAKVVDGARTAYYWDDDRLAAEVDARGALRLYVYPDERALVPCMFVEYAALDAAPESGRAYYVFHDQVGVPVRVEDGAGAVVWRAAHVDPYGELAVAPGAGVAYHLRFPGHYLDPETGLHYNRFRYYSPGLGRYLQSDPLGQAGGINLYAYPANPLVRVDVLGLHAKDAAPKKSGGGNAKKGPDAEAPAAKKPKAESGVEPGDVDSYRELNRRAKSGDGIDHDHIPAYASTRDAINKQRTANGELPLTKDEERMLKQNLTTAAVDHDVHSQGRTYKGRGGAERQAKDADDLRQAAADDLAEHKKTMVADGADPKDVDAMADRVHKRNEDIGLYDDPIPSSLWDDTID